MKHEQRENEKSFVVRFWAGNELVLFFSQKSPVPPTVHSLG